MKIACILLALFAGSKAARAGKGKAVRTRDDIMREEQEATDARLAAEVAENEERRAALGDAVHHPAVQFSGSAGPPRAKKAHGPRGTPGGSAPGDAPGRRLRHGRGRGGGAPAASPTNRLKLPVCGG